MKRLLTALVLIPVVTALILWAPPWLFSIGAATFALFCWFEYAAISRHYGAEIVAWHGILPGLIVLFVPLSGTALLTLLALGALIAAMRNAELRSAITSTAFFVLGLVYIFGAWRGAVELRQVEPYWLLFALVINWAGDSAAFYVGRAIGRHKLAPRVSPGKSWEGAVASTLFAAFVGVLLIRFALPQVPAWQVVVLAVLGNLAGQLGDLAESALKRGAGVKDSGNMLPGHGGWLDRLDSSLFSMPVTLVVLNLLRSLPL